MVNACICTIGDEILIGQIVDTNSAFISRELNKIGVKVRSRISIGDDFNEIINNLENCIANNDLVVVTGGLGPTRDDITKKALSVLTNTKSFIYDTRQSEIIKSIFDKRGVQVTNLNREQALVPQNCTVIANYLGTAPGMLFKCGNKGEKLLISLPGVPYEMEGMFSRVCDLIIKYLTPGYIHHKTLVTFGMAESTLAEFIQEWESKLDKDVKLAYLPNPSTGIRLRLSVYNRNIEDSVKIVNTYADELRNLLGPLIYGEDDDTLESVLYKLLKSRSKKVAVAESCTGGTIMSRIITIPGSSEIISGGLVVYSNESKMDILNVKKETIEKFGAVSKECAQEMAEGVRKLYNADYAIATTGIAGPGGGTDSKPVGTVWISVAGDFGIESRMRVFSGDRLRNITRFSSEALNFLMTKIL